MTTIVYHDGVVAWDSRISAGGRIVQDDAQKMLVRGGRRFWCAGTIGDFEELCELYPGRTSERELECSAIMQDTDGRMYRIGTEGTEVWRSPITGTYSIGSGSDHALTAVDCGCTPREAIKMAAKRDKSTGGKIRVMRL